MTRYGIYLPPTPQTRGQDYPTGWDYETREEAEADLPQARRNWGWAVFIKEVGT